MAPHSSTLAWKILWTEEPGRLQSMGSLRVRHDWATSLSLFTFMHWRRKWQPTPVFLPGESQGRGAWWSAVYGVAQSRTRLKRLSSSSSNFHLEFFNVIENHLTFIEFRCCPYRTLYTCIGKQNSRCLSFFPHVISWGTSSFCSTAIWKFYFTPEQRPVYLLLHKILFP